MRYNEIKIGSVQWDRGGEGRDDSYGFRIAKDVVIRDVLPALASAVSSSTRASPYEPNANDEVNEEEGGGRTNPPATGLTSKEEGPGGMDGVTGGEDRRGREGVSRLE